jgi:VWFA-related protein
MPKTMCRRWLGLALVSLIATPLAAWQQMPVFRGGVEVVTVDVVVLDKKGVPVAGLQPADFVVTAGKRVRRIVAADYFATPSAPAPAEAAAAAQFALVPGPTNNAKPPSGRTFIFVVDVDEIRAGEGRAQMKNVADYLDRLRADDRVGVVSLPYGTPRIDPTTDRKTIRSALDLIAGSSNRIREAQMTPGEAADIARGDVRALTQGYWARRRGLPTTKNCPSDTPVPEPLTVPEGCEIDAERALQEYRLHTRIIADSLSALATAMAPLSGSKALVIVSEGLFNDLQSQDDVTRFAAAAERARVTLYALHLDAPFIEAATGQNNATLTRALDDIVGYDGMAEAAVAARGTAFRVVAQATPLLERIDTELSGYYLLSFERDANDRDGQREKIDVKVTRPGLDVRARAEFTPVPATPKPAAKTATKPVDPRTTMGELLKWLEPVGEIGLDVDTYAMPVAGSATDVRVLVAAEIARDGKSLQAIGYEISDEKGKTAADTFDAPPTVAAVGDTRARYAVTVPLAPGRYRMKIGVLDTTGRRGSVAHAFEVHAWPNGGVRVSDAIVGDTGAAGFRPLARIAPGAARIVVRVEAHADTPEALRDVRARLRVEKVGDAAPLDAREITLPASADPRQRVAIAAIDVANLPAGMYVVTIVLEGPGGEIATRTRRFEKQP